MSFFDKLHEPFHGFVSDLKDSLSGKDDNKPPQGGSAQQAGQASQPGQEYHSQHRFMSFAPERRGNDTKWYVDGCTYNIQACHVQVLTASRLLHVCSQYRTGARQRVCVDS
jgi:hypothetical protein